MIAAHAVVPHEVWLEARTDLLAREKEFTRLRDELAEQRRALPWEEVEKTYVFDGPDGKRTLGELFDGRSQLIVYHFMYPADWDAGCSSCSFWADNFDPIIVHLNARDVTMVAVSRAPARQADRVPPADGMEFRLVLVGRQRFQQRPGGRIHPRGGRAGRVLQLQAGADRPHRARGDERLLQGRRGRIFHTYSAYARGIDLMNTAYNYLDTVPKGRDEGGRPLHWVRRHDEYAG